jgi:pre-mRNA-splicing factor 38A
MGVPSDFLCILLKLLLIKPENEVIQMFLDTDYRYLRLLGAVYIRLTGKPKDVYEYLEPLYLDYRKLAQKQADGSFTMIHMDECIEIMLNEKQFCNIQLPPMVKRYKLEEGGVLKPRVSPLQAEVEALAAKMKEESDSSSSDESSGEDEKKKKKKKKKKKQNKKETKDDKKRQKINKVRAESGLPPLE